MSAPIASAICQSMAFTKPLYDRERFNRAGAALLKNNLSDEQKNIELVIVNNWRSAHGYPLQCIKMNLLKRAQKVDSSAIIAQRLKRLPSIQAKLAREPSMRLTQIQDIGGCRAVLSSIDKVDQLVAIFHEAKAKNPARGHQQGQFKDYIANPKRDGYRSYHLVYKFRSGSGHHAIYNDQKIEIQIRTKLQHAWATAVEIVDTFSPDLKSGAKLGRGDPKWRRFFELMGSAIAMRERRPIGATGIATKSGLKEELRVLSDDMQVKNILSSLNAAVDRGMKVPDAVSYLLILDLKAMRVTVKPFTLDNMSNATDEYLQIEKQTQNDPQKLAVLVAVKSINALRAAYPNYYLDANAFLEALEFAVK